MPTFREALHNWLARINGAPRSDDPIAYPPGAHTDLDRLPHPGEVAEFLELGRRSSEADIRITTDPGQPLGGTRKTYNPLEPSKRAYRLKAPLSRRSRPLILEWAKNHGILVDTVGHDPSGPFLIDVDGVRYDLYRDDFNYFATRVV